VDHEAHEGHEDGAARRCRARQVKRASQNLPACRVFLRGLRVLRGSTLLAGHRRRSL